MLPLIRIHFVGLTVVEGKPKPTSSGAPRWEAGEPLSFAWWDFATEEAKREYRSCQIDSRRMSYRLDMKFDLLEDLVAGKLIAFGFRDGAAVDEGPVLIPAHLFPHDGEDTAAVDWENSALRSSGFSFLRIRVAKPEITALGETWVKAPEFDQTDERVTQPFAPMPSPIPTTPRKKMGRPSVEMPLRAVIRKLDVAGQLQDKSRKEQFAIIREAARAERPDLFLRETQPSRDKIYAALRAERLI